MKTANSTTRTNTKTAVGSVPTSTGGTVRFGSAVVFAMPLTKAQLKRNVDAASKALVRAAAQIIKAGIQLQVGKKTPMYRADPKNPMRLIQELNGRTSVGTFVHGKFKASSDGSSGVTDESPPRT